MSPKISIIIPTYNRYLYLEKAIKSIQNQDFTDYEVLVVDDGSTDNTKRAMTLVCREDERIKYFYQKNSGRSAARNLGINNAANKWLLFLDSDDMLADNALSFLASKIEDYPEAAMIGGTYIVIDEYDAPTKISGFEIKKGLREGKVSDPYLSLIRNYYLPMGSYIVHRSIVRASGGFASELEPCEDYDFCLRMARVAKLAYFYTPVAQFRKHGGNTPLDVFYATTLRVAYKNLAEINDGHSPVENKNAVIAEWKHFIADDFYNRKEFKDAFYNYVSAAFYDPKKLISKTFWKQVFKCILPKTLKDKLKSSLSGKLRFFPM